MVTEEPGIGTELKSKRLLGLVQHGWQDTAAFSQTQLASHT